MVVAFSWHNIIKKAKLYFKIIILAIILFYILPQLLSLLWYVHYPEPKIRDEHLLEKPLRVSATLLDTG
jgi:hypothetical protein